MKIESVFLDASFWIALRNPREQFFDRAHATMTKISRLGPRLVTTMLVAAETHAFVARNRRLKTLVLNDIENNPIFSIERISPDDEKIAFKLLREQADKSYSLCDAISFVLMRRMEIARALTFDAHFQRIGWFQVINHPDAI